MDVVDIMGQRNMVTADSTIIPTTNITLTDIGIGDATIGIDSDHAGARPVCGKHRTGNTLKA
jgi:hypothetical protein